MSVGKSRFRWFLVAASTLSALLGTGCGAIRDNEQPMCNYGGPTVLMAEAVPTASMVPCVRSLPIGWRFGRFQAGDGNATFTLDSDVAGKGALEVDLLASCVTGAALRTDSDESGATLYTTPAAGSPGTSGSSEVSPIVTARWFYRFQGGCTELVFTVPQNRARALEDEIRSHTSFISRASLDHTMLQEIGRSLNVAAAH